MALIIPIKTNGDEWNNRDEVIDQLYQLCPTQPVEFDLRHEGISLKASGIIDVVDRWITETNRPALTICFNTPNVLEKINYQFKSQEELLPRFFRYFDYFIDPIKLAIESKLFGIFLGRFTLDRNIIALDILKSFSTTTLISRMHSLKLENNTWWHPEIEAIGSLDNKTIQQQYNPNQNTNQSLLQFYNQFQIEIIAETVTRGDAFFPTEKTTRPIMGSKLFLAFAPPNYLKNIRDLGFKTFGLLWSEEYDALEGLDRWQAMYVIMQDLVINGYDIDTAQTIVDYNYNHLQQIIKQ
jgi:hypothetical protein